MPFDIGFSELLVIGIVALIVVGPRDLPGMFRTLGRFTGKLRGMAREFSRAMEDAADEAGVKDVAKDLKGMSNPKKMGLDKLNEAAASFEKWEPGKKKKTTDTAKTDKAEPGPETKKLAEKRAASASKAKDSAAARKAERKAKAKPAETPQDEKPDPAA